MVYAAAGSAADLPCTLSYLPSAFGINGVTARWSRLAGGHLQDWGIPQNSSSRSFPLHLPAVGPGDAGQYHCAVSVGSKTISRDVTLAVVTGERRDREVHHPSGVPHHLLQTLLKAGVILGNLIILLKIVEEKIH